MSEICDCFEKNLFDIYDVLEFVIELVQLEEGQIRLQIVSDLLGLYADVTHQDQDIV
jgi:hypothetical protein